MNNKTKWTHISGMIRIDNLPLSKSDRDFQRMILNRFGNTVDIEDRIEDWDFVNTPCGSDSSIQYEASVTRRGASTAWGHVSVWGDLMDYDDVEAIVKWIRESSDGLSIRSATVMIEVTGDTVYHLGYIWNRAEDETKQYGTWQLQRILSLKTKP